MEFQPKGTVIITVPHARYTHGVPDAVRGHAGDNEGSYKDLPNGKTEFIFGPCMAEGITLTKARKIASAWTRDFRNMLNELPKPQTIRRYLLLDGRRLVLVESDGIPPVLFADSHASFDDDLWLKQFPHEVWE